MSNRSECLTEYAKHQLRIIKIVKPLFCFDLGIVSFWKIVNEQDLKMLILLEINKDTDDHYGNEDLMKHFGHPCVVLMFNDIKGEPYLFTSVGPDTFEKIKNNLGNGWKLEYEIKRFEENK